MKDFMSFNLNTPTNLLFGSGMLDRLGEQRLPGSKALLLISNGSSVRTTGTLARTQAQLEIASIEHAVCANVHENPSKDAVMEAAARCREEG